MTFGNHKDKLRDYNRCPFSQSLTVVNSDIGKTGSIYNDPLLPIYIPHKDAQNQRHLAFTSAKQSYMSNALLLNKRSTLRLGFGYFVVIGVFSNEFIGTS